MNGPDMTQPEGRAGLTARLAAKAPLSETMNEATKRALRAVTPLNACATCNASGEVRHPTKPGRSIACPDCHGEGVR